MKKISIRELHLNTGSWVRQVGSEKRIVVTDRGRPIATILPFQPEDSGTPFGKRKLIREFKRLPELAGDTTRYVSEDRDRG